MARKDIETLWDDVRVWLTDATRAAIKEAEDLSRHGRLKMDIMRVSREIEKAMAQLGGRVYDRASKEPDMPVVVDEELNRVICRIGRLETELRSLQNQYEMEKNRRPGR